MNKLQKEIVEILEAHNNDNDILKEALLNLASKAKASKQPEHPNYTEDDIEYKWCVRHVMYHPIDNFTQRKDGKYDHNCDVAVKQWRAITKDIRELEKITLEVATKDKKKLNGHILKIEDLKALRLSTYEFIEV